MTPETPRTRRVRWLKFSLVGAIGIGVQLAVLAILTRTGVHYLLATLLAVEAAVLHNFVWHESFTWRDRPRPAGWQGLLARLARFHAANAALSIVGNLLLMRWLAGTFRLPVIPANLVTITACWAANFLLSDRWVFLAGAQTGNSQSAGCALRSPMSSSVRCEKGA